MSCQATLGHHIQLYGSWISNNISHRDGALGGLNFLAMGKSKLLMHWWFAVHNIIWRKKRWVANLRFRWASGTTPRSGTSKGPNDLIMGGGNPQIFIHPILRPLPSLIFFVLLGKPCRALYKLEQVMQERLIASLSRVRPMKSCLFALSIFVYVWT